MNSESLFGRGGFAEETRQRAIRGAKFEFGMGSVRGHLAERSGP